MNKYSIGDHASYIEHKGKLTQELEKVIYQTLADMGEDIKGISWFSSKADEYTASKYKVAC